MDTPAVSTFQEGTPPTSATTTANMYTYKFTIFKLLQLKPYIYIYIYTCKLTQQHTMRNWLRIRAHGVLLNLRRLCFMLVSVEIMQHRDIMPPFSLIASVLFPCLWYSDYPAHFIFFSYLILSLILFPCSYQFPSVGLHPLLLCLYYSLSVSPLHSSLFPLLPPP